jgi:hypothetical protein
MGVEAGALENAATRMMSHDGTRRLAATSPHNEDQAADMNQFWNPLHLPLHRDAATTAPPTVTMPTLDLLRTHMAISSMDLDSSSELAKVIGDMAPLPEGIKPFVKKACIITCDSVLVKVYWWMRFQSAPILC